MYSIKKVICSFSLALAFAFNTAYAETLYDEKEAEPPKITEKAAEPSEIDNPKVQTYEIAPGLTEKIYEKQSKNGPVTAYFLEADKNFYSLTPALDRDIVPGLDVVSFIAKEHNAVAAVNASYFSYTGEILGVTRINGKTAGTTYFNRTALGITADGSVHIGKVAYDGYVTLGAVSLPVSGVDVVCGENGLVIHNSLYGKSTKANEYVTGYTIINDRVAAITRGDTPIPEDGVVVSAHGTSQEAFKDVQIGDEANVFEHFEEPWASCAHILGVGPMLLKDGQVHVTAAEEEFPGDIRFGRNPRAGFGITRDGNYLFAVVDGRQPDHSVGVTLTDFAKLFEFFGATDAMNFDGGASAELYINGNIANSPSAGYERKIGSALLLIEKQ